ncbi:hypothetical protein GGG16DRAFT_129605 [Schizophyllum commune]
MSPSVLITTTIAVSGTCWGLYALYRSTIRKRSVTQTETNSVVRTSLGQDAVVQVLSIGRSGQEQLQIYRKLGTGLRSMDCTNHVLPLLREIQVGNITLGLFPRVADTMEVVFGFWAKNSVGDILDVIMQALEGLEYIHAAGIAHRDAFTRNFLMQWHPESVLVGRNPVSRPRVYLIDFETAVEFSSDIPPPDRLCVGLPQGGGVASPSRYNAPQIPEMATGEPYDPFKLDVWQLASCFKSFDSGIPDVQQVFANMSATDPRSRLTADQALSALQSIIDHAPPARLTRAPVACSNGVM